MRVSKNSFLLVHLILPFSFAIVGTDILFLNGTIKKNLPDSPLDVIWCTAFIGIPHLIASTLSFFDLEYIKYYRAQLSRAIPIAIFGCIIVFVLFGRVGLFFIDVTVGPYHAALQQTGISNLYVKQSSRNLSAWKKLGCAILLINYILVFFPEVFPEKFKIPREWDRNINLLLILVSSTFISFTWKVLKNIENKLDFRYFCVVSLTFVCGLLLQRIGYGFFSILIIRVVHDFTSYSFYLVHDHNRNLSITKNWIYRVLSWSGLPVILLLPLVSLLVAFPMTFFEEHVLWIYLVGEAISFFHFYMEAIVWKQKTFHRKYL